MHWSTFRFNTHRNNLSKNLPKRDNNWLNHFIFNYIFLLIRKKFYFSNVGHQHVDKNLMLQCRKIVRRFNVPRENWLGPTRISILKKAKYKRLIKFSLVLNNKGHNRYDVFYIFKKMSLIKLITPIYQCWWLASIKKH